jgi:hypothetical protein
VALILAAPFCQRVNTNRAPEPRLAASANVTCDERKTRLIKHQPFPISGMRQMSQVQMDDFRIPPPQAEPGKDCPF